MSLDLFIIYNFVGVCAPEPQTRYTILLESLYFTSIIFLIFSAYSTNSFKSIYNTFYCVIKNIKIIVDRLRTHLRLELCRQVEYYIVYCSTQLIFSVAYPDLSC